MKKETYEPLKMVKTLLVIIAFVFMIVPFAKVSAHTVEFVIGPDNVFPVEVNHENIVAQPASPEMEGYVFAGWYEDDTYNIPFDFEHNLIDCDMRIYAKWLELIPEARTQVTLPRIGNHPVLTGVSESPEDYTVTNVSFYLGNDELDAEYTFLADTTYEVYVFVRPRAGAAFDPTNSRVYINDREASFYGASNDGYNTLVYTINYEVPVEGLTRIATSVDNVDYGVFVTGFDSTFANEHAQVVRVYNTGSTNVTLSIVNPSANGPFGNIAFDTSAVLEPNDYMDISLIISTGSAYSDTPNYYNGTYLITATDVNNNANIYERQVNASVNLLLNQQFTVTFNSHEGSAVDSQQVWTYQTANVPDPEPTRNGFVFMGWFANLEDNEPFDFYNSPITDNIELHAKWAEAVTVTVNVNGGNPLQENEFVVAKGSSFMDVAMMVIMQNPTHDNPLMSLSGVKVNSLENEMLSEEEMVNLTIDNNMTVYLIWSEAEIVENINIEIHPDVAGDVVELNYNANEDIYEPTITPSLHWDDDDRYGVFNPDYVTGACTNESNACEVLFEGTFVNGNEYYVRIPLSTDINEGHAFSNASAESVHITGGTLLNVVLIDDEHMVVYAKFTAVEHQGQGGNNPLPEYATVTFETNGGCEIAPMTRPGGSAEPAPNCEKNDFIFGGWAEYDEYNVQVAQYNPGDDIYFDEDITLYAIWYDEAHRITNVNVGLEPLFIGSIVEMVEMPDPYDPNYSIFEQSPLPDAYSIGDGYHIGYREWATADYCGPDSQEMSYYCGGNFEGEVQSNTYYYAYISVQTNEGYFFDENILNNITVNGESPEEIDDYYSMNYISFIAKVRSVKENYEVRFMDGENELFTRTIHYKNQVEQPNPAPTKPDNGNISYVFEGWYSDDTLNTPYIWESPVTEDFAIYAKWTEVNNGGNNQSNKIVHYYDGETLITTEEVTDRAFPLDPAPTKDGFTFVGWYAEPELENEYDFSQNIQGDSVNIYAKFIKNKKNIAFTIEVTNTIINMQLNGTNIIEEDTDQTSSINITSEKVGYYDENNTMRIIPKFGEKLIASVTINDVEYTSESAGVTVNADEWVIVVPGSSSYNVHVVADEEAAVPVTIIWANVDANENAADYDEDMVLEHGSAKIIGVYNDNNQKIGDEVDVDNDGMGYAVVEPGSKVLFEFVPEYGYQLTSVMANGLELEPQEESNRYVFIMPNTNVHFQATFKQTKDIVKSNTDKVESGTIELGKELDGGSVKLTISDVELTSDKIKGFEDAAKDYTLKTYLDIDLYNIFYKGKDDANDVWSNKIDELDKEATITIKLSEDVDLKNIVLVHNVHDGDTYEIIEILSYDENAHTITFKTKSFSNYAIAVKNAAETPKTNDTNTTPDTTSSNPKTYDNIGTYVVMFVVSLVGLALLTFKSARTKRV